jgi:hypothetical protein
MVYCTDVLTLDAPKRTKDGYMAVRAKAARTGVYDYAGPEVDPENKHGLRDTPIVKVLRDDQTVFDTASAHSFIGKPITDNHPAEPVTSKNWKDLARGTVMGAMRSGDYLAFDLLLTDADAIAKVDAGKRELSNGYSTDLQFGDFTAPDGTKCQARQTSIVGNHVALVDRGRAGSECAIKDGFAACDALPADIFDRLTSTGDIPMKTLTIDGLRVPNVSDEAEAAILKLQADMAASKTALADATTAHDKAMAAKDKEIDDLKAKVVDQDKIDALADAKSEAVTKAKSLLGDKTPDFKGKTVADVRRETVRLVKGDAAIADKSDDYIEARFDGLTDGKSANDTVVPIGAPRTVTTDNASVRDFARAAQYA